MQTITVGGESQVPYSVLKDYHSTALAVFEIRVQQSQPLSIEYSFDIDVQANDVEEAEEMFLNYAHKLNELGVASHIGNLVFLTQAIRDNEGSYIHNEAPLNDTILPELESLQRLLTIQNTGDFKHMQLEFTSSRFANKEFDCYTRIQNPQVYKQILSTTINTLFESIKSKSHLYSFDIATTLEKIEGLPTLKDLDELVAKASSVKTNQFNAQLIYTISLTLLNYLNEWSPLNPDKGLMTNDELRVIYQTLKIHNLLDVTHDLERDALNYIRMLITNRKDTATMLGRINEYLPGEGIKPHKDRAYYENQICGVNLGSGCIIRFIKGKNEQVIDIEIPRRSLYVMQDDARKKWKHGIPPRKKDNIDGTVQHRERRVSITYRKVKPGKVHPINPEGKVAKLLRENFNINLIN